MSNLKEINEALNILKKNGHNKKSSSSLYNKLSNKNRECKLKCNKNIAKRFKLDVGYSDHTDGYEAAIGALCMGASVIEKHITLNNNLNGPDHKASLNPKIL